MAGKGRGAAPGSPRRGRGPGAEGSLVERYRTILVDQFYLRNEFDEEHNLNREYRDKFEGKLRKFLHEEVLTREMI